MAASPTFVAHPVGRRRSPLRSVVPGAVAGAVGTAAMDAVQYLRYRAGGGKTRPLHYEFAAVASFEQAPAPAQIAKRLFEALFHRTVPDEKVNLANNVMHWGYGMAWGGALGLVAGTRRSASAWWGPLFGTVVFVSDYVVLPPTGLYRQIWEYDARTLSKDWADHVVYGSVTAVALRMFVVRGNGRARPKLPKGKVGNGRVRRRVSSA